MQERELTDEQLEKLALALSTKDWVRKVVVEDLLSAVIELRRRRHIETRKFQPFPSDLSGRQLLEWFKVNSRRSRYDTAKRPCPRCKAPAGYSCVTPTGRVSGAFHAVRWKYVL